eukprot:5773250-Alexandrium_andersonii.AAC.1
MGAGQHSGIHGLHLHARCTSGELGSGVEPHRRSRPCLGGEGQQVWRPPVVHVSQRPTPVPLLDGQSSRGQAPCGTDAQ